MEEAFLDGSAVVDVEEAQHPDEHVLVAPDEVAVGAVRADWRFNEERLSIPDGQHAPISTWRVFKLVTYFFCLLSTADAAGNVAAVVDFARRGEWAPFVIVVCFMTLSSCLTSVAAAVGDNGAHSDAERGAERGILDADGSKRGALMAFFKLGGFRIAYRTLWFIKQGEIMAAAQTWEADEDLCEHLLPLFMFVSMQAVLESWPILLVKCFVLGRYHGLTGAPGGTVLMLSTMLTVALLAAIPVFVDKISCDFRQVYVRGRRSTSLGKRFYGFGRLGALFAFRFAEALGWYLGLVLFARVFMAWYWLFWGADVIVLSVIYCMSVDSTLEDWEVAVAMKILFQVFFTAPHHSVDSDVVVFFRARSPSRWFARPTHFPMALHFGWRLFSQGVILLCICTAGRAYWLNDSEWLEVVPWMERLMAITLGTIVAIPLLCWLVPTPQEIVAGIGERKYLLFSKRPDDVGDELYDAVLGQQIELYSALSQGAALNVRSWVLHEHAILSQPRAGNTRFQMTVSRERLVDTVLESVRSASQAELRRGPQVSFGDDQGEIGDDQGGPTREMYSEFARRAVAPDAGDTSPSLLRMTSSNRVLPVPCELNQVGNNHDLVRRFEDLGRVCGMALWHGELLDVSLGRSFLRRVIDLRRAVSMEENMDDLLDEDPVLHQSFQGLLKAAEEAVDKQEDLGLVFERSITDSGSAGVVGEHTVPLVEGGSQISVCPANATDFVAKYLHHMMSISVMTQANAFRTGLLDVLGDERLIQLFSAAELQQLLGGADSINSQALERWRQGATISEEATGDEDQIGFFWGGLASMTEDERAKVLAFATGCPRMPVASGPAFVINLHPHEDPNNLPTAHTCTNTINLPPYTSEDKLVERFRVAIKLGINGFGLA